MNSQQNELSLKDFSAGESPSTRWNPDLDVLTPEFIEKAAYADPMTLWNLWEGEESVEELLASFGASCVAPFS